MKVQIMSDLHLEFGTVNETKSFLNSLDPTGVDVLILAGDICTSRFMLENMHLICKRFLDSKILWVHGNHEYYYSSKERIYELSNQACKENSNLIWLNNDIVEISGKRFLGTTLWFEHDPLSQIYESLMNDFNVIDKFGTWVYEENRIAKDFLFSNIKPGDIAITHHLPSNKSIHAMYNNSALNQFFCTDLESEIRVLGPSLWVHGHTHHYFDYQIPCDDSLIDEGFHSTRVICNPRGYPGEYITSFNSSNYIEL